MATHPGVRQGYTFGESAIDLGRLVVDGVPDSDTPVRMPLASVPQHGLVTGADGAGKTTTLRMLAEGLSGCGVPAVLVDLDGDISGPAQADRGDLRSGTPVALHAVGDAEAGASVRATVRGFGPSLLGMVLGLDDMQADALREVFDFAAEQERRLLNLADLQAVLHDLAADSEALARHDGMSSAAVSAIARSVGMLVDQGSEAFFGATTVKAADLLRTGDDGAGVISVLALPDVSSRPVLCAALLLWLLAELAAAVPDGKEGPTLAFLVDDAQHLFDDASKDLVSSIHQALRSVQAKGIGVFLAASDTVDLHPHVRRRLRTRIQHASAVSGDAAVTVSSATGTPASPASARLRVPRPFVVKRDLNDQQPVVPASADRPQRPAAARGDPSSPVFKSYARSAASAASREIARELFGTGRRPNGGA